MKPENHQMNDTPRTDSAETFCYGQIYPRWIPSHLARQLERELASVTAERDALVKERDSSYEEVVVPLMKDKQRLDWLCDTHAGLKWQRLDLLVSRGAIDAELARSKEDHV